jgi:LysM repeat protein
MRKRVSAFLFTLVFLLSTIFSFNTHAVELSVNRDSSNISFLMYTVQPGDNLWAISHRLGVTVNSIIAYNGLRSSVINVGQVLKVGYRNRVTTVNYRVGVGQTLWELAQKYKTSTSAIINSNFMKVDYLMPGQIVTIPLNSSMTVRPIGIWMLKKKRTMYYGDIYTWENGRRLFTVGTKAVVRDVISGRTWNIRYYGGSNHSDIEPLTSSDTNIMYKTFGYKWSWVNKRPVVVIFYQGGIKYQIAGSLIGMPHADDSYHIAGNGMAGHCCLYFYNATGHSNPQIDPVSQSNVLRANGQ